MRKVALVFILAVLGPSLVLAWLAVRSLRDQQFVLERQRSLLYQGVADSVAKDVQDALAEYQHSFSLEVTMLLRDKDPMEVARTFDAYLRKSWPMAQLGFVVTLTGQILSPTSDRPETRLFYDEYSRFLANRETAEVYLNTKQAYNDALNGNSSSSAKLKDSELGKRYASKAESRNVIPQQQSLDQSIDARDEKQLQLSKIAASEAEFRQLIGDATEGTLARFVDNKLNVLFWYRPPAAPPGSGSQQPAQAQQLVFGAQLNLAGLKESLAPLLQRVEPALRQDICIALLDDFARPIALTQTGFQANWKHPFVATELGETLPHWEVGVYLLDPLKLRRSARTLEWTLGLLIALLVMTIGTGSWLIVRDLNRQLALARQKTDFVSNVSHELKTPLTSIRMFSELLAEGRVADRDKQRSYLGIITAESARLTRLINNVLDFARLERGEKKYQFQTCELVSLVRETAETYRQHLEANGFVFQYDLPQQPLLVKGDHDALAQVLVNLLSNAEKYSGPSKDITVHVQTQQLPLPYAEVQVLDRGVGIPAGCEVKIFEKFYRAHDSLSSGVQGSGLGLTLARQIARAHGGDVVYQARNGGGSCFSLRLPLLHPEQMAADKTDANAEKKPETT